jgi:hypothetical protein
MNKYFTKDFYRFFFGFMVIIAVAFGVMIIASAFAPELPDIDNIAHPD